MLPYIVILRKTGEAEQAFRFERRHEAMEWAKAMATFYGKQGTLQSVEVARMDEVERIL